MIPEHLAAEQWIRSTLSAGTALCALIGGTAAPRIWAHEVPGGGGGTAYPAIVIAPYTESDYMAVNGARQATEIVMRVRAVAAGQSMGPAGTIAAMVDGLLHGAAGTATLMGGTATVLQCVRTAPFAMMTEEQGRRYNHVGAVYELTISTTGGI